MASAINTATRYQKRVWATQVEAPRHVEAVFAPTLIDLHSPMKRVTSVLQWRRQFVDFVASLIGGAASLR